MLSRRNLLLSAFWAPQDATFSTDVKVVTILATVRNKQGQILKNLTKDDFSLDEDGRTQTIRYFSRESNLPLTLGLTIDVSGSQRRLIPDERNASYTFLEQVLREDKDLAFVIHFEREVELLQDLTSSRQKLEQALEHLEMSSQQPQMRRAGGGGYPGGGGGYPGGGGRRGMAGGTSLYDAILLACDELMRKQAGRKALIVLSDGVDNASKVPLSTAIESAQRAETMVYSILFADEQGYHGFSVGYPGGMGGRRGGARGPMPTQARPDGKKVLQQLSRETGGGFFEVSKKQPIEKIYAQIEEELRNQYSLGYSSDAANDYAYRKIRLAVKQKDAVVQCRPGYYPTKAS